MTPLDFLEFLESDREAPGVVFRDPESMEYLIAPPGDGWRYTSEGFFWLGKVSTWRDEYRKMGQYALNADLPIWILGMDVENQLNAEAKEKGR